MTLVLSSALGSALVLAALAKIPTSARRTPFLQGLGVSRRWSNALTDSGMVLEGGLGVCLIANIASPGSTVVAATTGAAFLAVQIAARVRGVHVPCNCFGVLDQAGHSWFEITRAAAFFGLALFIHDVLVQVEQLATLARPLEVSILAGLMCLLLVRGR
jgi:hypothetical protein